MMGILSGINNHGVMDYNDEIPTQQQDMERSMEGSYHNGRALEDSASMSIRVNVPIMRHLNR